MTIRLKARPVVHLDVVLLGFEREERALAGTVAPFEVLAPDSASL